MSLREVGGWCFGGRVGDVEDPKSGLAVQLMVHGEFSIRVENPQKIIGFFGQQSWSSMGDDGRCRGKAKGGDGGGGNPILPQATP